MYFRGEREVLLIDRCLAAACDHGTTPQCASGILSWLEGGSLTPHRLSPV